jgi:predicted permease
MFQDLRFAFRMIAAHRWFSAAVIVTLALGIGINTTVFTLVNAVLFKPVPIPGGERIVTVMTQNLSTANSRSGVSYPDFREWRTQNHTLERLEAALLEEGVLSEKNAPPVRHRLGRVSAGLFEMLRTPPILGRGFSSNDDRSGAESVVLLGHRLWKERFAAASDVIGRVVRVNGLPATIVGVMPDGFRFPNDEDFWMPLVPNERLESRANRDLQLFGLRKPGVSIDAARADFAMISAGIAAKFPDTNKDLGALVRTFHETYNGDQIRVVFLAMLGAVGFVLLIACANVANMMLGRAIVRSRELSVRAALGASRGQLVRQLLVESVVLSCLGGLLGLGLAALGVHAFDLATQNVGKPYWVIFDFDYTTFAYFAVLSVLSGILFGLVPALRASRVDLNTALKDDTRASGGRRGGKLTAVLVVFQFALTVVLLACAGMMIRSFFSVQRLNPFVPAERIFTAHLQLPEAKGERYAEPESRRQFCDKLVSTLAALPGVTQVAVASHLPGLGANNRAIEIEGHPAADPKQRPRASYVVETPQGLSLTGVPLLMGRGFSETDGAQGKEAAIVTREFAEEYWPGESAMGKRFCFVDDNKPGTWMTIIGVTANVVQDMRPRQRQPLLFIPYRQEPWGWISLLLKTSGDPSTLAAPVRASVAALDQDLPLFEVQTLPAALDHDRWFLKVFGTLFLTFAITGLLMAAVGIYAVIAQATARRTREIGIRIALGATSARILQLVLSRGVIQIVTGLVLGLGGAFGATQVLAKGGILMGVSPNDPLVFVAIAMVLVVVGVFACWLPARRAAALEPNEALRQD